ncbi:MAG: GTP 3',8-cyclase MoaA [Deltaproteobacteria bacterium]|nr:GTP 3',8-cyclase MoaA [Nannocystaceae bacterium]
MSLVQLRHGPVDASPGHRGQSQASDAPLVDRSARRVEYLRLSLTDRCNYRCTYCMPDRKLAYGPRAELLALEEVILVVAAFARMGVGRVRLTGGEPTLRRGLVELVAELARVQGPDGPIELVMTTNGESLAELAAPLRAAGLAGLTVSLDSLRPDRFAAITRRGHLDRVVAGIEAARAAGFPNLKLNTVAIRGFNDDELAELAEWAWQRELTPRFIEVMPMAGGELFVPGELMPAAQIRARVAEDLGAGLVDRVHGRRAVGPARYVAVVGGPWDGRLLGTIGAMTENFCGGCNRLRVSATGQLHGCLAHDDAGDLRGALRRGGPAALESVVRTVLGTKRDGHGFHTDGTGGPQKAMISIGG